MDAHILSFLRHELHIIALAIMFTVYVAKVIWILRFKPMVERTPAKGNEKKAIAMSLFSIAMPWTMESTSKKWYKWIEFAIFHIGITFAIITSFLVSFGSVDTLGEGAFLMFLRATFIASLVVSLIRLSRRIFLPVNRAISHPDDYFSIAMMVVWFALAALFAFEPQNTLKMGLYLAVTAFLIAYVPFSKMSHYIMWPFARYYFGKHFGHRGVYPKVKGL